MAKAKLLRQYLEDYNRKVLGANEEYQGRYDAYKSKVEAYNAAGADYEAFYNRVRNSQDTGVLEYEPGVWAQVGGHEGELAFSNRDKKGNPYDSGGLYSSVDELNAQATTNSGLMGENGPIFMGVQTAYVRNPDGTVSKYVPQQTPISYVDANGNPVDPNFMGENGTSGLTQVGGNYQYVNQGNFRVLAPPSAEGIVEPEAAQEVRAPNLTQSDIRELRNPSQDAAGVQAGINKGLIVKSELADNERSKVSAFADPEDPNNLKDAGILARVLGGQL